jgi:hypothetical protein
MAFEEKARFRARMEEFGRTAGPPSDEHRRPADAAEARCARGPATVAAADRGSVHLVGSATSSDEGARRLRLRSQRAYERLRHPARGGQPYQAKSTPNAKGGVESCTVQRSFCLFDIPIPTHQGWRVALSTWTVSSICQPLTDRAPSQAPDAGDALVATAGAGNGVLARDRTRTARAPVQIDGN